MKKNIIFSLIAGMLLLVCSSCSEDSLSGTSMFKDKDDVEKSQFDKWLSSNFITKYNIDFKYRYEDIQSDMNYNVVPAKLEKSIRMAKLTRHLCLQSYDELTGSSEFIATYYPKLLHMVGSAAYKNNGTVLLATAENGYKITLYALNELSLSKDLSQAEFDHMNKYYFHTLHHEFAHILHQTKPYSTSFNEISGPDYIDDSWNTQYRDEVESLPDGFITPYSSSAVDEDFVELLSTYITISQVEWDKKLTIAGANGASGKAKIIEKFEIVYKYMQDTWNIDLDDLREIVLRRQSEVFDMDLDDIEIKE